MPINPVEGDTYFDGTEFKIYLNNEWITVTNETPELSVDVSGDTNFIQYDHGHITYQPDTVSNQNMTFYFDTPECAINLTPIGIFRNGDLICTWNQLQAITSKDKDLISAEAMKMAKQLILSQDFMKQAIATTVNEILNTDNIEVLNAIEQKIKRIKAERFLAILEEED